MDYMLSNVTVPYLEVPASRHILSMLALLKVTGFVFDLSNGTRPIPAI